MANGDGTKSMLDILMKRREEERLLGERMIEELGEVNQASQEFEAIRDNADKSMMKNLSDHAAITSEYMAQQSRDLDELLQLSNELTDTINTPLRQSLDPLIQLFSPEKSIAGQSATIRAKQTEIAVGDSKQELADNELQSRTRLLQQRVQNAANRVSGEAQDVESVQNLLSATAALRTNEQSAQQDFVTLAPEAQLIEAKRSGDIPAEMIDEELAARETRNINLGLQRISFAQQRYLAADDAARKEMIASGQISRNYAKRVKNNQRAQELDIEAAENRGELVRLGKMSDEELLKAADEGTVNPITAQEVIQGRLDKRTASERARIAKNREQREEKLSNVRRLDTEIIQSVIDNPQELKALGITRFEAETILADRESRAQNQAMARTNRAITEQAFINNALSSAELADLTNPQSAISKVTTVSQREQELARRQNLQLVTNQRLREAASGDVKLTEQMRMLLLQNMDLQTARSGLAQAGASNGITTIGGYAFRSDELQQQVDRLANSATREVINTATMDNARISMDATMSNAGRAIGLPTTDASLGAQAQAIIDSPNSSPALRVAAHQALVALGVAEEDNVPASSKITITQNAEVVLQQAAAAQAALKLQNTPKQRKPAAAQYLELGRIQDEDIAYAAIGSQLASGATSSQLHDAVLGHLRAKVTSGNSASDLLTMMSDEGIPSGQAVRQLMEDERVSREVLGIAVANAHQNVWESAARQTGDTQLLQMLRTGDRAIYDANGALDVADMFTVLRAREGTGNPMTLETFLAKASELAPAIFRDMTRPFGDSAESIASLNKVLYTGSPVRWHLDVFDMKIRQDQARSIETERRTLMEPSVTEVMGP